MRKIKKRRGFSKYIFFSFYLFIIFIMCNIFVYLYCYLDDAPLLNQSQSFYLYNLDNEMLFNDNNQWISIDMISDNLINATLDTEDKYFYKHFGFDYPRILKAILVNIKNKDFSEGASTITQQYARNLFLNYDKTWKRKVNEAILSFRLESHYSKDEILEGYLNTINYGSVFGIENASYYYFGHSSSSLSLAEASMLAGIPQSPSNFSPYKNYDNAKKRQKIVLDLMVNNGDISEDEANRAYNTILTFNNDIDSVKYNSNLLYFEDAVIDELYNIPGIPDSLIGTGGLRIYTTLDSQAQESLEASIVKNMDNANDELQVSGVMIDPNNGGVLALMGGRDYKSSSYNRTINSLRQVGSTMKPILYYEALENGFTSSSSFISEKTTFSFSDGRSYSPRNYNDTYANSILSMGAAISYSDNVYAVKTNIFLGEENLVNMARKLGIHSNLEAIPSLALGTKEITLLDMVNAYSSFASLGYKNNVHFISRIEDSNGNVIYNFDNYREKVLDSDLCYILNEMLTYTYDKSFISYSYPTLISLLPDITNKYSVKSGTTNTDYLIIGYNKNAVLGIWTGYDDNRSLSVSDNGFHRKIWANTMEEYLKDKDNSWYSPSSSIVGVMVNPITGAISHEGDDSSKLFYFLKGTEPVTYNDDELEDVWKELEY